MSKPTCDVARQVAARTATLLDNALLYRSSEEANRSKDGFLAIVSHELRTPLSPIMAWASILNGPRGEDPVVLKKGLGVIHRNAHVQAKLIEDILEVSRIITGKLRIESKPLSLAAVVQEAVEVVRPSAVAKEIVLAFDIPSAPCLLIGDPERLRQVVWNLLSNAVKFTERGGRVRIQLQQIDNAVQVEIVDTAGGLLQSFSPMCLNDLGKLIARLLEGWGLGLGLAIVRHLVELHGGKVKAESAGVGRGSKFTIQLPTHVAPLEADEPDAQPASKDSSGAFGSPGIFGITKFKGIGR